MSASQNGVLITDATRPDDPIVYVNRAFGRLTGYTSEEAIGRNPRFLQGKDNDQTVLDELRATREADNDDIEWTGVLRNYRKDGTLFYNELSAAAMRDKSGSVTNHVGIMNDVTERKMLEDELACRALHDPLTGLPNRSLFMERLTRALERSDRRRGRVAVLFLDLDRFKLVNDSLGHEAGDELLAGAAQRLRGCVRPQDTVARHGGDEFTVLLEGVRDSGDATRLAGRIIEELRSPFVLQGHELVATTSVGIAVSTHPQEHPADLLKQADAAMYQAKERGKDRYAVFEEAMNAPRALERLELEEGLRRAPERGELRVHYQSKVDLETGRIVCVEALARWERPGHGLVPPSGFLPVAEETGLVIPVGR